ncbi:MAG: uridine kinase [Bacteroidia bacterium]|nr:uridine kinase [Bacteroidia bacterium]
MRKTPFILGICGGSGSGKTFLLHQLIQRLPSDQVTVISQDHYYKKLEEQHREPDGLVNFDHPDSVRLDLLLADIHQLISGQPIELEEYVFNNPHASPSIHLLHPAPLIIVEGLFIFHKPEIAQLFDLKVFVEADEHRRLARRLVRDIQERGYSMESILRDYERFVAPMYQQFIAPAKDICDLIIPNNGHLHKPVQVMVDYLTQVLKRFQA